MEERVNTFRIEYALYDPKSLGVFRNFLTSQNESYLHTPDENPVSRFISNILGRDFRATFERGKLLVRYPSDETGHPIQNMFFIPWWMKRYLGALEAEFQDHPSRITSQRAMEIFETLKLP